VSGKRLEVNETISTGTLTSNLDSTYTYDNEGKMTSVSYPATTAGAGPLYTNSFDSMSRLSGLTDQNNNTDVSGVSYNAANKLLGITHFGANETRQYNSLFQLIQLTTTGSSSISYTYNYPAGTNNGKINSQVVSGETISYQYDSLNRMVQATSSASWGESYGYDAFCNLLSKTPTAGSPPTLSQAVNPANNQIVGQTYDANGNQLSAPAGGALTYDSENRLLTAPGVQYAYDSKNKRVWAGTLNGSGALTAQAVFVYGATGQMLGEYSITVGSSSLTVAAMNLSVYFGGKRIAVTNSSGVTMAFSPDRLGSSGQFYPYGEGKGGNNPADTWSFGTYWTDSATGLDYANQRYFSSQFGRFMTPDPYLGSGDPRNPESWDRYVYTLDDPVNIYDPLGLRPTPRGWFHIIRGTVKVAAGVGIVALSFGASTTGVGAIVGAIGIIGGLGTTFDGALEIGCGFRGNNNLCDGGTAVSNATNPCGLAELVASGGNQNAATIATGACSVVTSFITGWSDLPSNIDTLDNVYDAIDVINTNQTPSVTSTVTYPVADPTPTVTSTVTYLTADGPDSGPLVNAGVPDGGGGGSQDDISFQEDDDN
jgi:RHS repeat-associated protein